MASAMDSFYSLTFRDAFRAGEAMANAFANDPIGNKLFEGESELDQKFQAFFEVSVRFGLKYGKVYSISDKLEGIAACVPGKYSDISFWRLLRSGALGCGMRMGMTAVKKIDDFQVLSSDRAKYMMNREYMYLVLLGVKTEHQGKGFGGRLLRALIADCDAQGIPIYLETETENNVRLYEHFGFKSIRKISLETLKIPMWEMIREPNSSH